MAVNPRIIFHNVDYSYPDKIIFSGLNLTIAQEKIGLVGRNGTGKTSLLRLILNELQATQGRVEIQGRLAYCPQQNTFFQDALVSDVLGVGNQLNALTRVLAGSTQQNDFDCIANEWDLLDRMRSLLFAAGLEKIALDQPFNQLSGGEQTRLFLAKIKLMTADFLLLDEPTNHLDIRAREELYHFIKNSQQGIIIASHDRDLLSYMEKIIELSTLGVKIYGGNYDNYIQQKKLEIDAAQQSLKARVGLLEKSESQIKRRKEIHSKAIVKGVKEAKGDLRAKGHINKLSRDAAKDRSAKTLRRITLQSERKLHAVQDDLVEAKTKIEQFKKLDIDLAETALPAQKKILEIKDLSFAYPGKEKIFSEFNYQMYGAERVAISGDNGSGKTTLIQLIMQYLQPNQGEVILGVEHIAYLDQSTQLLDEHLSVLENIEKSNPHLDSTSLHRVAAQFLFKGAKSNQLVSQLSGGERLRAALACCLMAEHPLQLLILDEPSNHLDIDSLTCIEEVLREYAGALLVISHDQRFLTEIGIQKRLML